MAKQSTALTLKKEEALQLNISRADVVVIGVAKVEREIKARILKLEDEHKAKTKELEATNKRIEDAPDVLKAIKTIKHFAAELGVREPNAFKARIQFKDNRPNCVTLEVESGRNSWDTNWKLPSIEFAVEAGLADRSKQLYEEGQDLNKRVVSLKYKLGQIPALERQYRARLLEAQLNETEVGKELLARLNVEFDVDIETL